MQKESCKSTELKRWIVTLKTEEFIIIIIIADVFVMQLLLKAGGDSRQTVFLFSDSQIKDESFMDDVSMILNTGDVPNLYASDEKAEIIEKMQNLARNEVRTTFYCSCLCS